VVDPERLKLFKKTAYWQEMNAVVQHCMTLAEKKGMNLAQFAELCDLSPQTIRKNADELVGLRQELTLWKMCLGVGLGFKVNNRTNGLNADSEFGGIRKALNRKPQRKRIKKKRGKKQKGKVKKK
jgi:hypothetical protein